MSLVKVKDFEIGQHCISKNGVDCVVTNVAKNFVTIQMNKVELNLKKVMYAGVYART